MEFEKDFEIDGHRAVIIRHPQLGHLCGYLSVPPGHMLHGKDYDDESVPYEVHGGWTYAADHVPFEEPDGSWYFGFDCAHAGDLVPGIGHSVPGEIERDVPFVEGELRAALVSLKQI